MSAPSPHASSRHPGVGAEDRDAEDRLDAEALLSAIVDSSNDAIIGKRLDGTILSWNAAAEALYGYSAEEAIGQHIRLIVPPEKRDELETIMARLRQGKSIDPFETVRQHRDGSRVDVALTISPITSAEGHLVGASAIARDISERRRYQQALAESERRFRVMANGAPVMIWMAGTDKACTFFNAQWLAFTGRSLDQELDDGWAEGVHPEDRARCLGIYTAHFDQRTPFEMAYRLRHHSGAYRWILDRGTPRHAPDGTFLGYIGSATDISKQKSREHQLLDAVGQAVIATDLDGTVTFWNQAAEDLYGWSSDDALGRSIMELTPASVSQEQAAAVMERLVAGESWTGEFEVQRRDGSTFPALVSNRPIYDQNDEAVGIIGVSVDLTEQKQKEETLRRREARHRALLEAIPDLIFRIGRDGTYLDVGPAPEHLLVRPAHELVGKTIEGVLPPDVAGAWMQAIGEALDEQRLVTLEYALTTLDGQEHQFEGRLMPMAPDEVMVIARDVTERKQMERAVATERDRLHRIVMKAPAFMAVLRGPDHVFELVNEGYYDLVGRRDLIGRTVREALPEVEGQGFLPLLDEVYATGEPFEGRNIPARVKSDPDLPPKEHFIDLSYLPLYAPDGSTSGILAHGVIVTEQVKSRRRLELLRRIDQAVLAARSPASIGEEALRLLGESIPYALAAVALFDVDADRLTVLATRSPAEEDLEALGGERPLADHGNIERLLQGRTVHTRDLSRHAPRRPVQQWLHERGFRATLSVPLMVEETCVGALNFAAEKPFREEHVAIAEEAAASLAVAIHSAQLTEAVEAARQRQEALSHRLVQIQEQERRHLALELHDEIGQVLTSIALFLRRLAGEALSADAQESADRALHLAERLTNQVRGLSLELRPPMLDDLGLLPTLEWYVRRYTRDVGITVDFRQAGLVEATVPEAVRTTAFRVVQEALTNVARHAQTDCATVKALLADGTLYLRVEDRGVGFDPQNVAHPTSGGLSGIRERAALLDGQVEIDAAPGAGTTIIVTLPVRATEEVSL
ncbi:MAG: PAS domain S-box protein [Bacteroidetes bacterium]|jgi:PAS domain S-box-containing protein|nr:PAS domain S-box protein [Bacteroidota bacterium]